MQTTLLGLAIAFILALIAALVGPYFVDWTQLRPRFEAEATRLVGLPVRVEGEMAARLLPTPSLRLRNVEIGAPADNRTVTARQLDIAFSLGSLMRGEWRADEMTLNGLSADIGLDPRGRIDWLTPSQGFNLASLAIDRLNLTGELTLRDAASGTSVEINDIDFTGDVRALGSSIRGEGTFLYGATRYPFRLSSGQTGDNRGTRVRFTVEPGERLLTADVDGVVSFEAGAPRFEGAVTLARPVSLRASKDTKESGGIQSPWRISARVKAEPAQAKFEQLDMLYGAEDAGLRLSGVADMRFGVAPELSAVLTARQFDADRLLAQRSTTAGSPAQLAQTLAAALGDVPRPPLATQISVGAESVTLGGRPVQAIGADLRGDTEGWTIDRLELRAPGTSRVAASGRLQYAAVGPSFKGTASIDANDPDLLMGWLQGKNEFSRAARTLRASGNVAIATNNMSVDGLRLEMDGGAVEGRISYLQAASGRSRLDADLKADRFDLDTLARLVPGSEAIARWPDEARVWLDFGRATVLGQEARQISARLAYDDQAWTMERLGVADIGGISLEGSGALDRAAASGRLAVNANAPSIEQLATLVAPVAPAFAARLRALPDRATPIGIKFTFQADKAAPNATQASARAALELSGPLNGTMTVTARPAAAALRGLDAAALLNSPASIDAKWTAPRAATLAALLGLDRIVATRPGGGELTLTATGVLDTPMQTTIALKAEGLDLRAQGAIDVAKANANLDVAVQQANIGPLVGLARGDLPALNVALKSRLTLSGGNARVQDLTGTVGAARVTGRGTVMDIMTSPVLDGELGIDALDGASALRLMIGDSGAANEPVSRGLIGRWRGKLAFQALGATIGALELRPLSGVLSSDGATLTLDALAGNLGGGTVKGDAFARENGDGIAIEGRLQLANVDGAVLRFGQMAMPPGRVTAQLALQTAGRTPAMLIGALSGNGTVKIDNAKLASLNPGAFEAAIRASDQGVNDPARLRETTDRALAAGALAVPSVEFPLTIRAGRLRIDNTTVTTDAAQLAVSGSYDLAAADLDLRASLASTTAKGPPAAGRPEIRFALRGSPDAVTRNLDASPLMGWLAVRAIDRETQRLDQLDRNGPPRAPNTAPMNDPAPSAAPSLAPTAAAPAAEPAAPPPAPAPRPAPRRAAAPPAAEPPTSLLPALPPPIDVRPPPGAIKRAPQRPPQAIAPGSATSAF